MKRTEGINFISLLSIDSEILIFIFLFRTSVFKKIVLAKMEQNIL